MLLVAGSALSDLIVALIALFALPPVRVGGHARLDMAGCVRAVIVTSLFFGAKMSVFVVAGWVTRFGLIALAFADLAFVLPLLGAAVLGAEWRGRLRRDARQITAPVFVLACLSLLALPLGGDAMFVEPFRLRLETARVELPPERDGVEPLRIGVLADIQTDLITEHEQRAVTILLDERPDMIFLPGDVFHGTRDEFERELPALRALLGRLHAPGGVWFVAGDVDWNDAQLEAMLADTDIRWLDNTIARCTVNGRPVTLGGVSLDVRGRAAQRVINRLCRDPGTGDIRILMAHRPDVVRLLPERARIDLVVAGHTHGGQVVLPLLGPPITLSRLPRHIAAGGLHVVDGNRLYISRGVGWERGQAPRIRFLCPPEVSLLHLYGGGATSR